MVNTPPDNSNPDRDPDQDKDQIPDQVPDSVPDSDPDSDPATDSEPNTLPKDAAGAIGGWMIGLLWLGFLVGGTLLANQWLTARSNAAKPYWNTASNGSPELILKSDRYGQYELAGSANGQRIEFLVDTGASQISIPAGVADRLNLRRGRGYPVQTANGEVIVFATQLDEVSIGPFTMNNVPAHVNPGMNGEMALLGMSFLRHFELKQSAGELTISAP